MLTDSRFSETFGLTMVMGRWWNEGEREKVVLNREAARVMGLSDPIGTLIRIDPGSVSATQGKSSMREYEVVGVVDDFHTLSFRNRIYPTLFRQTSEDIFWYLRVDVTHEQEAIDQITKVLHSIDPSLEGVQIAALTKLYDQLTYSEKAGFKIFSILATVCLLISLFGIYGVVTASILTRRKEIAIRKVIGAEIWDVVSLFFRESMMQVVISEVIAIPFSYYLMYRWLQGYAYHIEIAWWLMASVVIVVISIVILTVAGQVIAAAKSNPAQWVKSE